MKFTRYEKGYLMTMAREVRGSNAGEVRSLLKLLDTLDVELEDGATVEVDTDLMKKCWDIIGRFQPRFETSERGLELAEKLEGL